MDQIEGTNIQIIHLVDEWVRSVQDKNLDGSIRNHAEDVVIFDVVLPLQSKGLTAYAQTWELFFANNRGGKESFDLAEFKVVAGDSVAFCYGLVNVFHRKVRITIGLKKVDSGWVIAHEHHSYPIKP